MSSDATSFVGTIPAHPGSLRPGLGTLDLRRLRRRHGPAGGGARPDARAGDGRGHRHRDASVARSATRRAHITATDLNAPMLEVARARFEPGEQVEFRPADATALPFLQGAFDAVVCQFGLMFFPDQRNGHREARRVLAPGGHHVFSVWDAHRQNPFGRIAYETVAGFFPSDPPQFYQVPFSCHGIDPIEESLVDAGFTDIRIAVVRLEKQIPEAAAFARGLVHGNPLIGQIRARGGVDIDRVVDALTAALHREFGADPGRMPLQAIVFEARRR